MRRASLVLVMGLAAASHGIAVFDLNDVVSMPVYIDGADEITPQGAMIKGGGAALTREKIVASAADRFVCIADGSKLVETLGKFPLPVEVKIAGEVKKVEMTNNAGFIAKAPAELVEKEKEKLETNRGLFERLRGRIAEIEALR